MKRIAIALLVLSEQVWAEEPPKPAAAVQQPPSAVESVLGMLRPYATLKPAVIPSSGAVESFGQPNASAVTAAGNPVVSISPGDPRLTFQVAQSRLGLAVNEAGQVRAQLEVWKLPPRGAAEYERRTSQWTVAAPAEDPKAGRRVLVRPGDAGADSWRFRQTARAGSDAFETLEFDDSAWLSGSTPFGDPVVPLVYIW